MRFLVRASRTFRWARGETHRGASPLDFRRQRRNLDRVRKAAPLITVLIVLASVGASADRAVPPPNHVNYSAAFIVDSIPTADPCVIEFAQAEVEDFVNAALSDQLFWGFGLVDICTLDKYGYPTVLIDYYGAGGFETIPETAFSASQSGSTADLTVTLTGFERIAQTTEPVTLNLHWQSPPGVMRDAAIVTGTLTSPRLTVELDDSIVWNEWSSIFIDPEPQRPFTVAGLWFCQFRAHDWPGCFGQA